MASESVKLFRLARFDYAASAAVTFQLYTDLPGTTLTVRETLTLPASATRRSVEFRLNNTTKGRIFKARLNPAGAFYLYGGSLYLRRIGRTPSDWMWHPLPIPQTSDQYVDIKLPIEPTQDGYAEVKLPIEQTEDGYSQVKLPIEPTEDGYAEQRIPMRMSPDEVAVVELPMDE